MTQNTKDHERRHHDPNNLGPMWVKENLAKAKADLNRNVRAYKSLKNKDTQYAKGILRIMKAKAKVVQIWQEAK